MGFQIRKGYVGSFNLKGFGDSKTRKSLVTNVFDSSLDQSSYSSV